MIYHNKFITKKKNDFISLINLKILMNIKFNKCKLIIKLIYYYFCNALFKIILNGQLLRALTNASEWLC